MAHLYAGVYLCTLLDALHDNMEYPYCIEVSWQMLSWFSGGRSNSQPVLRFFAWYLFGISGCLSPILYSTVNTIVKDDSEERALIMVRSIMMPRVYFISSTMIALSANTIFNRAL